MILRLISLIDVLVVRILRDKNPCSKSGQYGLEVENNKISIWSLNL
jgi:hypothetical protein